MTDPYWEPSGNAPIVAYLFYPTSLHVFKSRKKAVIDIDCDLSDEYFGGWDSLTPEIKKFWEDHTCFCEGSGVMSSLCDGCPFCSYFNKDELES